MSFESNYEDCLLIVFYKNPIAGKVKTRLGNEIGYEKSLAVYQNICTGLNQEIASLPCDKLICYSEEIQTKDLWSDELYKKEVQEGKNLGDRMKNAFVQASTLGYKRIVLIGTDIPDLNNTHLDQAFEMLQFKDKVIGPSHDGGYYLIGSRNTFVNHFDDIRWSSSEVLQNTLRSWEAAMESFDTLPILKDVDETRDLEDFPFLWKLVYGGIKEST